MKLFFVIILKDTKWCRSCRRVEFTLVLTTDSSLPNQKEIQMLKELESHSVREDCTRESPLFDKSLVRSAVLLPTNAR